MILDFNTNWIIRKENGSVLQVNLPHDVMLTEERDESCHNGVQSGYFPGGKYVYERTFDIKEEDCGKHMELLFEGVYQKSQVYINDKLIDGHRYGYSEFTVDISNHVQAGENRIKVHVDNSLEPNCRWYSGSGMYRPVWLKIDELSEPKITTISYEPAVVQVEAAIGTEVFIYDKDNQCVAEAVIKDDSQSVKLEISDAKLWNEKTPYLYTCLTKQDGKELHTRFGIRRLEWNAKTGLSINGERVLLRGGCIHHDNGVLGACGFADAEKRRVRILKEAGYNAIRSAHNPMSRAMLDACDELGMYVMDESFDGWYIPKNYHDYSRMFETEWKADLEAMVNKDYNHPCVIMYSTGNEVSETSTQKGVDTCGMLTQYMKTLDDTRPITCGVNVLLNVYANMGMGVYREKGTYKEEPLPPKSKGYKEKKTGSTFFNAMAQKLGGLMFFMSKGKKGDKACKGAAENLDIIGFNYAGSRFEEDVKNYPDRMMVASETMVTDLPYNWERVKKYPAVVGDFVWASWDYLGEAGVGDWMYHSYEGLPLLAGSGTIDITGNVTAEAYFQQVVWGLREKPYIGVRPINHAKETPSKSAWRFTNAIDSWNWHGYEGEKAVVEVYSQAHFVRLELNGKVIGTKQLKEYRTLFNTVYEPGDLVAIALDENGKEISRHSLHTGDGHRKLTAIPERSVISREEQSLCYIPIRFTGEDGQLLPYVEQLVSVKVEGEGYLAGIGSALTKTNESYLADEFTSYRGALLAVVRANGKAGKITVQVSSRGVTPVTVEIETV